MFLDRPSFEILVSEPFYNFTGDIGQFSSNRSALLDFARGLDYYTQDDPFQGVGELIRAMPTLPPDFSPPWYSQRFRLHHITWGFLSLFLLFSLLGFVFYKRFLARPMPARVPQVTSNILLTEIPPRDPTRSLV